MKYVREKPFPERAPEDRSTSQQWVTRSGLSCKAAWESHHLAFSVSLVGCRLCQQEEEKSKKAASVRVGNQYTWFKPKAQKTIIGNQYC